MYVVFIRAYLYKMNLITKTDFHTYFFQTLFHCFCKYLFPILCWTYNMI